MNRPQIDIADDSYYYTWTDLGVSVGFNKLREKSDGLHGELWVVGDTSRNGQSDHIQWTAFNLSSATTRRNTALQLARRPGGQHVKAEQWIEALEFACTYTAQELRRPVPLIDLSEGDPPLEIPYLVYPLLPERQPTVLFASGESSKGWLALGICLSLRLGGEVLPGLRPVRQCNSLYLDWETEDDSNKRRLLYMSRGLGLENRPAGVYYQRMHRPLADELGTVRELLRKTSAELLVIDSIGPAAAGSGSSDIRDSDAAMRFMSAIRTLRTTSLLIGHVSKAVAVQKGSDAGSVIGSTFYQLLARSAWELKADADSQPIVVGFYHRKANLGPRQSSFALKLTFRDKPFYDLRFSRASLEDSVVVADRAPLPQRMVAALRHGSRSTSDLAEDLGVSQAEVRNTGRRLAGVKPARVVQLGTQAGRGGKGRESLWGLAAFSEGGAPATSA